MDLLTIFRITLIIIFGFYLSRSDLKRNKIPDKVTFPLIIFGIILNLFDFGISEKLVASYLILLGLYFLFTILYIVIKHISPSQTIGGGDVKFTLVLASLLPFFPTNSTNIFIIKVLIISIIVLFVMTIIKRISLWVASKSNNSKVFLDVNINSVKVTFVPILWISAIISLII